MKKQTQQFLIDKTNHSAVQLDEKNNNIIKLIANLNKPEIKNVANELQHRRGDNANEVRTLLKSMGFEDEKIDAFLGKTFGRFGSESVKLDSYCRRPLQLGKETCEALTLAYELNFDHNIAELKNNLTEHPTTWDALKTACDFKPVQKAGEKAAKDLHWGKITPFAIGGALVGAAAIFGLDFFLQRRKISAETVETQ